jgi:hypothetical protein
MLRFEQVQENDTRKTSNEVFQTLRFEKKFGKIIRGKQATFHFKLQNEMFFSSYFNGPFKSQTNTLKKFKSVYNDKHFYRIIIRH